MSSRLLLIDYFYQYLFPEQVVEATLCLLDKNIEYYQNQNLMNFLNDNQNIKIYHLKMPRVFEKEYPLMNIQNSILEFAIENLDINTLKYQDLLSNIKDPYYQKDIRNIKCNYIHLIKILENENVKIILLAYSKKETINLKLSTLKTLEKKILQNEEEEVINSLNKHIVENTNNYYIFNEKNEKMYFSQTLQEILHVKNYYDRQTKKGIYDNVKGEINKLIRISKTSTYKWLDMDIYFFTEVKNTERKVYSLCDLEVNKKNDHLTIIYLINKSFVKCSYSELFVLIDQVLKETFIQDYDYYFISSDEFYVIINSLIEQRILEKIKIKLESIKDDNLELEVFYLNTAYNISIDNLDFIGLGKYLRYLTTTGSEKFEINDYKNYLHKILETNFLSEEVIGNETLLKEVIDSVSGNPIGKYLGYYHIELEPFQRENYYHHASEYICSRAVELTGEKLYFRISYQEFLNKKIWYNIRRIDGFCEKNIVLSEIVINTQTEFKKFISDLDHLHQLNFKIFVDSSIFASIMMNDVISHFEGIYVEDYEMSIGDLENDSLFKTVVSFYLKENKLILLHQLHNYYQFKDPNILYINENND